MSPDRWSNWEWEQIADHESLTEGPAWDGSGLLYNECAASTTYRYDPATGKSEVWREGTNAANGMVFDREGRLFACEGAGRRVVQYDGDETIVIVDQVDGKRFNEPNDLAIDSSGRIWFSDPNYGGRPMELDNESVYRADPQPDGSYTATRVAFDTERPNGVLLSKDEKRALRCGQSGRARQLLRRNRPGTRRASFTRTASCLAAPWTTSTSCTTSDPGAASTACASTRMAGSSPPPGTSPAGQGP